jgi:hypothetical protein
VLLAYYANSIAHLFPHASEDSLSS